MNRSGLAVLWLALAAATCTGDDKSGFGGSCSSDSDCASGVCWDAALHPGECFGQACSAPCMSDEECDDLAREAGDSKPGYSCGDDGFCDLAGMKLGDTVCAG